MNQNKTIPIVLIADKNYVMPVCVLLQSIYSNKASDSKYDIYVFTDNIDKISVASIKKMTKNNFTINVIEMDNKYKNLANKNRTVTNAAFLKFDIASIVNNYDKVLYLDIDTIVLKDLSELYNIDLKETYCGVVEDFHLIHFSNMNKMLGLKHYFNSGVLLLNTKKIREENLCTKMLEIYLENGSTFYHHDQDVLNLVFNDNITILPAIYNWMVANLYYPNFKFEKFYKIKRSDYKQNNISIIHYVNLKPWAYSHVKYQDIWNKYYKETPYKDQKLKLQNGYFMSIYYFLRGHFMLRKINQIIKTMRNFKG